MLTKEKIISTLKEIDKEKFGINKIGLFGSYVKGEATEESDVDILVEPDYDKRIFENLCDLRYYLENLFGTKVDIVTTGQFENEYRVPRVKIHKEKIKNEILGSVEFV